jgi:very-short-patch-repair endonuclease
MRREPTDAERKLWSILRGKQLNEHRFRRQFPIGGYIVDFICLEANLAIEADGGQHVDAAGKLRDERRDASLAKQGVRVLRFSDIDILKQSDVVAEAILTELEKAAPAMNEPPPQPSPGVPEEGEMREEAAARDDIIWSLLSSDLAQEIKSEFNGRLAIGLDVTGATQHVFAQFREALVDAHHGPVVILALAALQLKEHQLHAVIRDAALDLIRSGEAAGAFPAPTADLRQARRRLLEQVAAELERADVAPETD